jgi:hypothetical protein
MPLNPISPGFADSFAIMVGAGIGAKRILASSDDRNRVGLDRATLTGRFTVGIAF